MLGIDVFVLVIGLIHAVDGPRLSCSKSIRKILVAVVHLVVVSRCLSGFVTLSGAALKMSSSRHCGGFLN